MGLAASSGHDNDDLIDKLVDANIVVTHRVETALRLVDRRRFFPAEGRYIAYKDLAWKSDVGSPGRIHISAPCIYGNVLECLDLQEGNSFLNVGSGTGYLSTVAGYLLGSSGTNHGVEIHPNIVEYAQSLVAETLHCPETQCYDWGIPEFSCGNGLFLSPSHYNKYDRVYCGAAVPPSHRRILWELLKINGILVMPYEDQLLQVRRQAANVFEVKIITSVSFSNFILPTEEETSKELYSNAPSFRTVHPLQFLCALSIRKIIRAAVATNHAIHIRNFVGQQPHRIRDNHVVIEFRDGERPVEQPVHFENRNRPFREILAIVGADFIGADENENNDEVERADPERRRLDRDRFRLVWLRHHLHITNRAARRRHLLEAREADAGTEDNQNENVVNRNGNPESNGSLAATTSDSRGTSADTAESSSDNILATGRSKKRMFVEHEGENSLSVKRRNDDDDGSADEETMETDVINDYKVQNISKQDISDKRSDDESIIAVTARETLTEPERSVNQNNTKIPPHYFDEARNSSNLEAAERVAENNDECVNRWTEEMVQQLQDLRREEAGNSGNTVMASNSKHMESNVADESMNSYQSDVQNGTNSNNNSSNFNHDGESAQQSSRSANASVPFRGSKVRTEANDKKWISVGRANASREFFSFSKDSSDSDLKWQNNRLYKNRVENNPTERNGSSCNGNIVDTGNPSGKSEDSKPLDDELEENNYQLVTKAEEREDSNVNGDENDEVDRDDLDDFDDDENDDDYDDEDDDEEDDDDDYDTEEDDYDNDGSANSILSGDNHGDNAESDHVSNAWDENELYLTVRETTRSTVAAINGQASTRNRRNDNESDSSDNDYNSTMEDESTSRQGSDARDELQTEEERKREQARLEERGRQLNDIRTFATVFERRIMELPLNRALKEYIKCLC